MTVRELPSLCLVLLAIMLTGIFERPSCAQSKGQAGNSGRSAMALEPPPSQVAAQSTSENKSQQAPSLRIALEIVPPAKQAVTAKPAQNKSVESQFADNKLAETKASEKKVLDLKAPEKTASAKLGTAQGAAQGAAHGGPISAKLLADRTAAAAPGKIVLDLAAPEKNASDRPVLAIAADEKSAAQNPPRVNPFGDSAATQYAVSQNVYPGNAPSPETVSGSDEMPSPGSDLLPADMPVMTELELAEPYWVANVLRLSDSSQLALQPLDFDQAIWDALAHSPYVKAVLTVPQISQAKISEATGIFDQTPFVDSIFNDTSDPVGSTLTTGGPPRLNETRMDNAVGVRAKNALGGTAELAQNFQLRNNNSVFLSPKEQADAKMLLRLNQPLMRGAGRTYTTSSIRIAEFQAGVTQHEAMRKLQLHAQAIANAYWNLFAARAIEMQAERGTERLIYLRDELAKRADIDGLRSQLLRAEAAIARQVSTRARAQADVITAQASLRALVNSPTMVEGPAAIMPATPPVDLPFVIDPMTELQAALAFHPDLLAARDRIKAATTRLNVAENELRPTLNLVMEGYLHGLNGEYGMGDSLADQFSRGRPSYAGGLNYQRPYRNIVSKAILRERRLELRQLLLDLDNTLLTVTAEVEQAIADIDFTNKDLVAAVKSTLAFDEEVRYLNGRWQNAYVETTQPSLLLDELLNAQNQLIQAENSWARAQAEHMIAFVKLHVATGMLLNSIPIPACE